MWKQDDTYENEFGKCAFLAGAMETLTGDLDVKFYNAGVKYEALASDVFCIGDGNVSVNKLVKERLKKLIEGEYSGDREKRMLQEADRLNLKLQSSDKTMKDAILDLYENLAGVEWTKIDKVRMEKAVDEYCIHTSNYLGKPQKVFEVTEESFKSAYILGEIYLGMIFNVIFVKFESHLLMFLRGSCE